jgi:hypothetical protein
MATWYSSKGDCAEIQERHKKRKEERRRAELKYPGKRIGYKDGVLIFLDSGQPVSKSQVITEPDENGVSSGWIY